MPQLDASDLIDSIDAEIAVIDRFGRRPAPLSPLGMAVDGGDMRYGYLKQEGLKPTYGFLRDQQGTDTYLHRDNVSPHMWTHLNKGGRVRFSIGVGSQGRTFAKDVELDE
ncbi:hypothetical protein GCM10008942_41990 [Rhizomicrobium electricum]|uniref:Uncharacterized protein n=2 Tax=Rhizomicrobium electricum TaxID=480070 RepID=A0ABP3QHI7_9PROT